MTISANLQNVWNEIEAAANKPMGGAVWVTYREHPRGQDRLRGIVVDGPHLSTTGVAFVAVNNFANRIPLANVISVDA